MYVSLALQSESDFRIKARKYSSQVTLKRFARGHWEDLANQRKFLDSISSTLNISKPEDWYKVKSTDVIKLGGKGLLNRYNNSLIETLKVNYPEQSWDLSKFEHIQKGFWSNIQNQREFFDQLGQKLQIREPEDWLQLRVADVNKMGGSGLLKHHHYKLKDALCKIYPELAEIIEKKDTGLRMQPGHWTDINNQRAFFDQLGQKLNIEQPSDWYKVTWTDVVRMGGSSILNYYNGSLHRALSQIYPETRWEVWKWEQAPKGAWKDSRNVKDFIADLEKLLAVKVCHNKSL